jgi:phenylacetate-CoA ligase
MSAPTAPSLFVSALACADHAHADACRYQVEWSINPHMVRGAVDFHAAVSQHARFVAALEASGAQVTRLPFVHGAFDSVFVKDPALLIERGERRCAVLARPRFHERARERAARAERLRRHGYDLIAADDGPPWEGGDLVMTPSRETLFLGHGFRSSHYAAHWLERAAELDVCPLELIDPHLYHLDMAFAMLPDGTAVVCADALAAGSMHAIERARGVTDVVAVRREDALAFGLNWVVVGDAIVCGARVPAIERIVTARGLRYIVAPLDQFHLAGGSAACLVAVVHRDARESAPQDRRGTMDMYGPIFRSVLFPLWETHVRQRPVVERWHELESSQWRSRDELRAGQTAALARLIRHAYDHVPFYRARIDAIGARPDELATPESLSWLPVVRRSELRDAGAKWESNADPLPTVRKQTSGTSGEPLIFGYEPDSEHWRRAVKYRGYAWAGYRPGDRALHFWGAPEPTEPPWQTRMKIALDRRMHRDIVIPCAVMTDEHLHEVVRTIERSKPDVLICYAQAGGELARFIVQHGLRTWPTIPVICGAERLLPRDRADLVAAFGPSVFDTYGCREVMMIGAECEAHDGLHIAMENLVVEVVVTEDGRERPAREGETGEVVITDLHNLAMPFIRYANGDVATVGSERRCACGRNLPRIEAVQGRISETLRDASGAPVSGIAISFLVQDVSRAVRQFQAVQHRDRSMTLRLALAEPLGESALAEICKNGARLLGGLDVDVAIVDELPRSPAGKHQLVIVE